MKNISHRYDINRPRPRHDGHKYAKYKTCFSIFVALCIKQHQKVTLELQFMKKLSNTESKLKKCVGCKKKRVVTHF